MMLLCCNQGHENKTGSRFCLYCGEPLWLSPGYILEKRYQIVSQLGQGGFGRTYLAEDLHRFHERCVLKEFAPQVQGDRELQKAKDLFQREAAALYKLNHPQLPKFREFFQAQLGEGIGCLFLAQDYVEGQTYCQLLKSSKRLSEADVRQLLCHLLPVLSYIHSQQVIHRDISPDNLILRRSDRLPVIIDFGGVKQVAATAIFQFTAIGQLPTRLGKQGYAPEEQLRQGQVFASSDLYALAVTALVLLTGKEPQDLYDSYKGTWRWRREVKVSAELETLLEKMLAYKPGERYQSAAAVLQVLQSPSVPVQPANISQMPTVSYAAPKPPQLILSQPKSSTQAIAPAAPSFNCIRPWTTKIAGVGLVILTGVSAWTMTHSLMQSLQSVPLAKKLTASSNGTSSSDRASKIRSRLKVVNIKEASFNARVDRLFHARHPELKGRRLTNSAKDTPLREEWYNIAEQLLANL